MKNTISLLFIFSLTLLSVTLQFTRQERDLLMKELTTDQIQTMHRSLQEEQKAKDMPEAVKNAVQELVKIATTEEKVPKADEEAVIGSSIAPEEAPVEEAPVEEKAAVVEEPKAEEAPVEEKAPVVEAPVEEAPVVEAPVVEAPVVEAPVVEAPVVEAPVEEAPVKEAPVVEAPVVEETKVEEAPVKEAPKAPEVTSEDLKLLDAAATTHMNLSPRTVFHNRFRVYRKKVAALKKAQSSLKDSDVKDVKDQLTALKGSLMKAAMEYERTSPDNDLRAAVRKFVVDVEEKKEKQYYQPENLKVRRLMNVIRGAENAHRK